MRLLERLSKAPSSRSGFKRQQGNVQRELSDSLLAHVELVLNHRLQPGSFAHSEQYAQWHPALVAIEHKDNRDVLVAYIQHMEPRIQQLQIRDLTANELFEAQKFIQQRSDSNRSPDGVFALEMDTKAQPVIAAVLVMSNGQLRLVELC